MGKTILSAIASALTGFFGGWLIYGVILMDFMKNSMVQHEGVYKEPPVIWAIGIANLCLAILYAWLYRTMNVTKFGQGFLKGIIIAFLLTVWFDSFIFAMMDMYKSFSGFAVDVVSSTILGACMGGVAALILGIGKKTE
ncbi:MAG: hypothetical protein A2475_15530 [Ignavibacteria bacterium RIFOXYC2_FULL_35_21]|nr:MAG: hypothetical protein A2475_15530 [Ignavibacteria bacterium RIFOXYC2_FULL_35_21]